MKCRAENIAICQISANGCIVWQIPDCTFVHPVSAGIQHIIIKAADHVGHVPVPSVAAADTFGSIPEIKPIKSFNAAILPFHIKLVFIICSEFRVKTIGAVDIFPEPTGQVASSAGAIVLHSAPVHSRFMRILIDMIELSRVDVFSIVPDRRITAGLVETAISCQPVIGCSGKCHSMFISMGTSPFIIPGSTIIGGSVQSNAQYKEFICFKRVELNAVKVPAESTHHTTDT